MSDSEQVFESALQTLQEIYSAKVRKPVVNWKLKLFVSKEKRQKKSAAFDKLMTLQCDRSVFV